MEGLDWLEDGKTVPRKSTVEEVKVIDEVETKVGKWIETQSAHVVIISEMGSPSHP